MHDIFVDTVAASWLSLMQVIIYDLRIIFVVVVLFVVGSTLFFVISDCEQAAFAPTNKVVGAFWPIFTVWRAMLGDFDADASLSWTSSIVVYMIFQLFVVIILLNLIIAIMGDSYEKVQENATVEALHEQAKTIVAMELQYPTGFQICGFAPLGKHKFPRYLHAATKKDVDGDAQPEWEGITGRVKQETNRMMAEAQRMDAKMQAQVDRVERSVQNVHTKVDCVETSIHAKVDRVEASMMDLHGKFERLEAALSTLVEQDRRRDPEV